MTPAPTATPLQYDRRSIALHWLTAALVVLLWTLGQTIDWFPKGTPRVMVRSLHITLGITLAAVFVARIVWRAGPGAKLPPADSGWKRGAARVVHLALYVLVGSVVAAGIAFTWVRGDTLFNLFTIPAFDPGNKALRASVGEIHELLANAVLILAALHAAAGLLHHVVFKDDVLRRMLPRLARR